MNLPYPQSIPCSFVGFPDALDIRMGKLAGDIVDGASWGSKFILTQTPKSGVAQGEYVVGSPLPSYRKIYSDTGSDDDFAIKVSFVGEGTFYRLTESDTYLRFQLFKAIAIETATTAEMVFGDTFDCETLIPADTDTTALFEYDGAIVQYTDPVVTSTDSEGYTIVEFDGVQYYLSDGVTIQINSATAGSHTLTMINGTLIFS